jgi:hypothetical protein
MFRPFSIRRLCAGLAIVLLSSNVGEAQWGCARHIVSTYPLVDELNYVSYCLRPRPCDGYGTQYETKRIGRDGGQIDQWLVANYNVSTTTYTPIQQDTIIQNARLIANNYKPASKYVHNIQFYWTTIPDLGPANYLVGANITYAKCVSWNTPR